MKIFLIFLMLGIFHSVYAQISFPLESTDEEIMAYLLNGKWNDKKQCLWKPTNFEDIVFNGADSSTSFLTEKFTYLKGKSQYKLLVMRTCISALPCDDYDVSIMGMIELEIEEDKQTVVQFRKFIDYIGDNKSNPSEITLLKISEYDFLIQVDTYYPNKGFGDLTTSFYSNEKVLSFTSSEDNFGYTGVPSEQYDYQTEISVDKGILYLHKKGTVWNNWKERKIIKVDEKRAYKFKNGRLERLCE